MVCFFILINGYFYGIGDAQHSVIPVVKKYINPDMYPKDYLVNIITPSYFTYMYLILASLTKIMSMEIVFFVIYFISTFFSFLGIFMIAEHLFNKKAAYLSVLFFLITKPALGHAIFDRFSLEPSVMGFPFMVFAIYFFLRKRYVPCFIVLGVGFNIHAILSLLTFAVLILYVLISYKKHKILNLLKYVAVFIIFASPLLIWRFISSGSSYPLLYIVPPQTLTVLRSVVGHHTFISEWDIFRWIVFAVYFLLFLLALKYKPQKEKHLDVLGIIVAVAIVSLLSYIFIEIIPISVAITFLPFRSTLIPILFFIIYISNYLIKVYEERGHTEKIVSIGTGAAILVSNFKAILLFFLLLIALKYRQKWISLPIFVMALLGFILGIVATFYSSPVILAFKLGYLSVMVIVFSLFISLFSNKKWFPALSILSLILTLLFMSYTITSLRSTQSETVTLPTEVIFLLDYKNIKTGSFDVRANIQFPNPPMDEEIDLQLWAKKNTKTDGLFITPPAMKEFRVYSERSIVSHVIDGATTLHNPLNISKEWVQRMTDLCGGEFNCKSWGCWGYCAKGYNSLQENDFKKIAQKYNADYVVIEKPRKFNFKEVYENEKYVVYEVR